MTNSTILSPGDNCWRIEAAERTAFLIDGEAYFRAFHAAVQLARHSIFILAWDIDTRLQLVRDGAGVGRLPEHLGNFLNTMVKRHKGLNAYVLNWDWAMLYTLEREWLPMYKLEWKTHRRLHFHFDGECPAGASQHQKVVVIDDTVAFVGGIDLAKQRWDTPEHRPDDPRRTDADGKSYSPFHDVQMLVEGKAAAALGELARERWYRATGQRLGQGRKSGGTSPWPAHVAADIHDAEIAIARTDPPYRQRQEVREVERLYLDAVAAAQYCIYIENQYFTSWKIGEALAQRLQEANGPEVVLVLPLMTGGWLEQNTMDVLRSRLLRQLREADQHGRLRVYFPHLEGLGSDHISLHSKIMVIDEVFLRLGSSNLSNRSMGLDSECDLAIEATDDTLRSRVTAFRNRLLAEHLGVNATDVAKQITEKRSLIAAIESLVGNTRTLKPLAGEVSKFADEVLPDAQIVDPERPLDSEQLAELLLPTEERKPVIQRLALVAVVFSALLALAAAWRWTPLGDWLDMETLRHAANWIEQSPFSPVIVIAVYLIGGLVAVPVTLLIAATVITFGPYTGSVYALAGAELSALLGYMAGNFLGRDVVRRFTGSSVNRLSRRLAKHGLLTVITVRIVPIAPFAVTNMVAGASHIRFRDFALGTLLGMAPGILAIALFADTLVAAIREPDVPGFVLLAVVVVIIILAAMGVKKKAGSSSIPKR